MRCTFYFVIEPQVTGLLERAATMTNKVVSEQARPLRDTIQTHAKAATLSTIHDKLNSGQGEALPEHEGERTG